MHTRAYDTYIPHAPELRDTYYSIMRKAYVGRQLSVDMGPPMGARKDSILMAVFSNQDAKAAASICEKWANERPVSWTALPCSGSSEDGSFQPGYIGCVLDNSSKGRLDATQVMNIMLKN